VLWCHAPEGSPMHYKKSSVKSFMPYCSYEQDKPFIVLLLFLYTCFQNEWLSNTTVDKWLSVACFVNLVIYFMYEAQRFMFKKF
jgi:hypothetical protein